MAGLLTNPFKKAVIAIKNMRLSYPVISSNSLGAKEELECGADPNGFCYDVFGDNSKTDFSFLSIAVLNGDNETTKVLFEGGATLEKSAGRILFCALSRGIHKSRDPLALVDMLIENKAELNKNIYENEYNFESPLSYVAKANAKASDPEEKKYLQAIEKRLADAGALPTEKLAAKERKASLKLK